MKAKIFISFLLLIGGLVYAQEKISDLNVKLGGDIQFHGRQFFPDELSNKNGDFFLRRSRLKVTGDYTDYFSFRILANYANSKINLQDSYLDFKPNSFLQFRLGKFKAPIGLELLQSPGNLPFIERSIVSNFVPNRDLGAMVFGKVKGILEYQLAIMNGVCDGKNAESENDKNKDLIARVFVLPFISSDIAYLSKLNIGIGFSTGKRNGNPGSTLTAVYSTSGRNSFFSYLADGSDEKTAYANGKKNRYVPQFSIYEGRLGIVGEYAITTEQISLNTSKKEFTNKAWHAALLFMLTNDQSSYGRVTPKAEFDPAKGNWGAIQIVARIAGVRMDDEIFPSYVNASYSAKEMDSYGVGINWYLNKYFKLSVNYEKTLFESGLVNTDLDDEDVLIIQTQVTF